MTPERCRACGIADFNFVIDGSSFIRRCAACGYVQSTVPFETWSRDGRELAAYFDRGVGADPRAADFLVRGSLSGIAQQICVHTATGVKIRLVDKSTERRLKIGVPLIRTVAPPADAGRISLGARVEVIAEGVTRRYRIVADADEWDCSQFECITLASPLAVALLGHRVGDSVTVVAPIQTFTLQIIAFEYPDASPENPARGPSA